MARSALSLAVASVPEGLPMIATTTQMVGLKALRKHGILVRRLEAIETLACVDVVCFDKTGTLTANKIAVEELAFADATLSIREGVGAPALHADGHPTFDQRSRLLLEIGFIVQSRRVPIAKWAARFRRLRDRNRARPMRAGPWHRCGGIAPTTPSRRAPGEKRSIPLHGDHSSWLGGGPRRRKGKS
jgi:magnesium-transporting ATPase (P-type)